jgi:transcriptional regulator with XRE-family HTH domain
MTKEISLDLKISRERSGLSGTDLAHLLGCNKERVSKLEHGKARITPCEIISLCLIYGKAIDGMFHQTTKRIVDHLKQLFAEMPSEPSNWQRKSADRTDTLNGLAYRLQALTQNNHEA